MRRTRTSQIPVSWAKSPIFWVILVIGLVVLYFIKKAEVKDQNEGKIRETAIDITSIKTIAEWEFLTIQTEEFIDTTIVRTLSNDQFARIYRGTIRLGMDMQKARKNWIVCKHDTAYIYLPAVEILDKEFIDEANTRTFYESGRMTATLKNKMYSKAKRTMKARAFTKQNIKMAEDNAKQQFKTMFNALGFKVVKVEIKK